MLTFDAPLDPAAAQDVKNYVINGAGPKHRVIPISWAHYDATARSVTLRPKRLMNFHNWFTYQLTVRGSATAGLADQAGRPFDGNGDGQPGGDLRVKFHGYGRVLPRLPASEEAKLEQSLGRKLTTAPEVRRTGDDGWDYSLSCALRRLVKGPPPGLIRRLQFVMPEFLFFAGHPAELPEFLRQRIEAGTGLPTDTHGNSAEHGPTSFDFVLGYLAEDEADLPAHMGALQGQAHDDGDILIICG